jgi:Concanavalin A-like lectin/glucanases superfamily/NHL repeat
MKARKDKTEVYIGKKYKQNIQIKGTWSIVIRGLIIFLLINGVVWLQMPHIANAVSASSPTPSGYWKFDEGSGTIANDSSGNNNPGTIAGATWTTRRVNDSALSFNGTTNYVSMGSPTVLKFGISSFTVISWFKTSNTTGLNRMVSMGDYGWTTGYFTSVGPYPSGCTGCVGGGLGGGTQATSLVLYTTSSFNDNNWHQAAMVIDQTANTAQIYVDGVAQTLTTQTGTCGTASGTSVNIASCTNLSATSSGTFDVGSYSGTQEFFNGSLDEVRAYDSALSSAQIANQYSIDTATTISPVALVVYGQAGNFTTNLINNTSGTANTISATSLYNPRGIVFDSSGNLYVADFNNNRVLYYAAGSTTATRVYGQGGSFTTGTANSGGITANTLSRPTGLVLDSSGNLYIADNANNRVLYYAAGSTTATRVYGQGGNFTTGAANSGGITANTLNQPNALALDSTGNLYVADYANDRVLYYAAGSTTATRVYGQGGSFTTGTANLGGITADSIYHPVGLALDSSGNLYVADSANNRVLYYPAGSTTATRVYGQGGSFTTGTANLGGITADSLSQPQFISLDASGNLYVADYANNRMLYYPAGSTTATRVYGQAGSFTTATINNGGVSTTSLYQPFAVIPDSKGNVYVTDFTNMRVLKFQTSLSVTTQPPSSTSIGSPFSVVVQLIDMGSGLVFSDFSSSVAVAIQAGTGTTGATLNGTTSVSAVSGVATFSNLSINTAGTGYILMFSSPGVGSASTNAFTIVGSLLFTPLTIPAFVFTLTGVTGTITSQHTFKVKDTTASGVGWHVTITSTQFVSGTKTLPTTALTITRVTTACTAGQTCIVPVNSVNTYPITVPAATTAPTAISYFSANGNTGTGDVTLTVTFSLNIPPGTASGVYTSIATETLVKGQ